jgi:hypothetical protein
MIAVGLLFAINATIGCASTEVGKQVASGVFAIKPTVTVKWLPPCSINVSEPYFTVDVFADGAVRYMGGPQAREIGERTDHISAEDTRRLLKEARRFVSGNTGPLGNQSKRVVDESYCLNVTVHEGATRHTKRGRSDVRQSQSLIKAFDETVHEKKWVCPSRYGVSAPEAQDLGYIRYCQNDPIARLYIADTSTCASGHDVDVFADGTIRYYAMQVIANASGTARQGAILGEQYHTLSRSDFDKFIELANGIELVPDNCGDWSELTNQPCDTNAPDWLFRSQDRAGLERLTQFVAQAAPITWATLVPDREGCPISRPFNSSSKLVTAGFFIKGKYVSGSPSRAQ